MPAAPLLRRIDRKSCGFRRKRAQRFLGFGLHLIQAASERYRKAHLLLRVVVPDQRDDRSLAHEVVAEGRDGNGMVGHAVFSAFGWCYPLSHTASAPSSGQPMARPAFLAASAAGSFASQLPAMMRLPV